MMPHGADIFQCVSLWHLCFTALPFTFFCQMCKHCVVLPTLETQPTLINQGQLCQPVNLTNWPACVLLGIHSFGYHIPIPASRRRRNFLCGQHRGRHTSRGKYLTCRPDLPGHHADNLLRPIHGLCLPRLVVYFSVQDPATRQFSGVRVYCRVVDLVALCLPRC